MLPALAGRGGCSRCAIIAFPCISTGVFGYPAQAACAIAVSTVNRSCGRRRLLSVLFAVFGERSGAVPGCIGRRRSTRLATVFTYIVMFCRLTLDFVTEPPPNAAVHFCAPAELNHRASTLFSRPASLTSTVKVIQAVPRCTVLGLHADPVRHLFASGLPDVARRPLAIGLRPRPPGRTRLALGAGAAA